MFVRCMRRVLARNKSARAKVGANKSPSIRANLRAVFFCDRVLLWHVRPESAAVMFDDGQFRHAHHFYHSHAAERDEEFGGLPSASSSDPAPGPPWLDRRAD